jgi:hypothetical protein
MPRVSEIPFEKIDAELQAVMREYDKELGGAEFVQVFAHAPEVFKSFIMKSIGTARRARRR